MINQQLLDYVRGQLAAGVSGDAIQKGLATGGWLPGDIAEAFTVVNTTRPAVTAPAPAGSLNASVPSQNSAVTQIPAPSSPIPQNKSSKKLLLVLASVLGLCVAGSAGAYYAFVAVNPSPTDLLRESMGTSMNAISFSFVATSTGTVAANPVGGPALAADFTLTMAGEVDHHDAANPAIDATLDGAFSSNTATDTGAANLSIHTIYLDKKIYIELNNFTLSYTSTDPKEAEAQLVVVIVNGLAASLEHKWIEADASSTLLVASSSPALTADEASLAAYANGMSYLTSAQNLGVERINGTPTYHLKLVLQFQQQLEDILLAINADQNTGATNAASYSQLKAVLDKQLGQDADVDIWVGKSDNRIYQLALAPMVINDPTSSSSATISIAATYGDYGKAFSIAAPAGAEPLQQVVQGLFGGLTSSSKK